MSVIKNIRVSFAFAFFSNPVVNQSFVDIKEGDEYVREGIKIFPNHQSILVGPYNTGHSVMSCSVHLTPDFFAQIWNFLRGKYRYYPVIRDLKKETKFSLSQILSISFNDGWDDSCFSFTAIEASEIVPNNRTRRIFDEHQILSPEQLGQGKLIGEMLITNPKMIYYFMD